MSENNTNGGMQLIEEDPRLRRRTVLENALENAGAVMVRGEGVNLTDAGVGDEDEVLAWDPFESAL